MDKMVLNKKNLWTGAISGVLAGIIFGFIMIKTGAFDEFGKLVGNLNPFSVFLMHIIYTTIIGIIFAMTFHKVAHDFFQCVMGGMVYGVIWWVVGHLILSPLMMGYAVSLDFQTMTDAFPMLISYLVFGTSLGLIYYLGRRGQDLSHPAKLK